MTLILTVSNLKRICQVSDRRLTEMMPDGSTRIAEDDENKAVYVRAADAHFALSYTGIARIGTEPMHLWISKKLANSGILASSLKQIIAYMQGHVMDVVNRYSSQIRGRRAPTIFVLAGYYYSMLDEQPVHYAFTGFVGNALYRRLMDFGPKGQISIYGAIPAVPRALERRLRDLQKKKFFERKDTDTVTAELVSAIRAASKDPNDGKFIGENCSSVTITPDYGQVSASHHRKDGRKESYPPNMLIDGAILRFLKVGGDSGRVDLSFTDEPSTETKSTTSNDGGTQS